MTEARRKIYAWLNLPFYKRLGRVKELGLYEESDQHLSGTEPEQEWMIRARDRCLVDQLLEGL